MDLKLLKPKYRRTLNESLFFRTVTPETADKYLSDGGCRYAVYEKGQTIFTPEQFSRNVGVVLRGRVFASKQTAGRRLVMNIITEGQPFGVATVFSGRETYETFLTAESDCKIVFFSQELLKKMLSENFCITESYIEFLTGRIHFLNEKIDSLSCGSAEKALAGYIVSHESDGVCSTGSLSLLAESLGIGRASLYRAIDCLETGGAVEKQGRSLVITDIEKLKNILNI